MNAFERPRSPPTDRLSGLHVPAASPKLLAQKVSRHTTKRRCGFPVALTLPQASASWRSHPSLSATRRRCSRGSRSPRSMTGLRSGCVLTPIAPLAIRLAAPSTLRSAIQRLGLSPGQHSPLSGNPPARARRNCSPENGIRVTPRSTPTNIRRRRCALFERESASASSQCACAGRRM